MNENNPIISLVCPCFNEEENLLIFHNKISEILNNSNYPYEIIYINDGSTDKSLDILKEIKNNDFSSRIINLSRNFGKEAALTAGLDKALGDVIIPIDTDFQDPPSIILKLLEKWSEGYDVVLAKRIDRSNDTLFKSLSAKLFYRFHNSISDITVPEDVGDFRLITRKVLNAIKLLPENQRFMKGIFSWVGFKTISIEYKRESRDKGKSSFSAWKLWNFAIEVRDTAGNCYTFNSDFSNGRDEWYYSTMGGDGGDATVNNGRLFVPGPSYNGNEAYVYRSYYFGTGCLDTDIKISFYYKTNNYEYYSWDLNNSDKLKLITSLNPYVNTPVATYYRTNGTVKTTTIKTDSNGWVTVFFYNESSGYNESVELDNIKLERQ